MIGRERSLSQTAISFCLAYDAVSTVIPGNANMAQLHSNVASVTMPIESELVAKLEDFYQNEVKKLNLGW